MAESRPTILQIIPELDTGGAELSTIEIAQAIVQAGGRALVMSEGGRLASSLADVGGELIFFPAATKNPARVAWNGIKIARFIKSSNVDLVHARSRAPAWSALAGARSAGVPFVTTYHGAYGEKGPIKKLYNSVMARSDIVIANSRYTAGLIEDRYGTADNKIRVIYRGVSGDQFDPSRISSDAISELRASWGVGDDRRIILNAARLTGWKGQSVIIEAVRRMKEADCLGDGVVILAGDAQGRSTYQDELLRQIETGGLSQDVKLVGHVDDMPLAFAAAFLSVVASTEPEAFGRAATEAQIMGCPVIATRIGAPKETVLTPPRTEKEDATGWLIEPGSSADLADTMAIALSMTEQSRHLMGARARAHVLSSFTLEAMKKQTLGVYDDLLGSQLCSRYGRHTQGVD